MAKRVQPIGVDDFGKVISWEEFTFPFKHTNQQTLQVNSDHKDESNNDITQQNKKQHTSNEPDDKSPFISIYESQLDGARSELDQLKQLINKTVPLLRDECNRYKLEVANLRKLNATLEERNSILEVIENDSKAYTASLENKIQELNTELAKERTTHDDYRLLLQQLLKSLDEKQNIIDSSKQDTGKKENSDQEEKKTNKIECPICFGDEIGFVMDPCFHRLCSKCTYEFLSKEEDKRKCYMCNKQVLRAHKIY